MCTRLYANKSFDQLKLLRTSLLYNSFIIIHNDKVQLSSNNLPLNSPRISDRIEPARVGGCLHETTVTV